jgi:WD40 repeat protein
VQRSFAVPLREKCWFGYISSESGAQRLHLFDPLLGTRLQRPESNSTDISVTDYKFSPDGKFIAYRVKDGSGNSTLTLWQSPGWDHEQELNLGGSVTEYSWSNNGQVLAAAIDTGTETLLGGISVAGVPDDQPIAGSIQGLYELQPVVAQVSSELTWYGADRYLAFSWYMADYDFDQLSQTNLEQSGFSAVESPSGAWYDPSLILYSSEVGFFAMVPATGELDFIAAGTSVPVLHTNVAIAPRGAYVASASNNVLSVYSASSTTKPPAASPIVTTPNCDAILGWAESQARIPCVDTATGTVKSHSIALQEQTVRSATVDGSQTYVSGSWKGYRRQVSRSGDRMILTTGTDAFMADLGSPTPALTWSLSLGTTPEPTEVSFSPNEELIAIQHGTVVQVVTTASTGSSSSLGKTGASAQACQDAQMSARDWCGTSAAPTQATWSRDSNVLAFVRDSQQLVAYDLRPFPNGVIEPIQVLVKCGGECIGTGVFQP